MKLIYHDYLYLFPARMFSSFSRHQYRSVFSSYHTHTHTPRQADCVSLHYWFWNDANLPHGCVPRLKLTLFVLLFEEKNNKSTRGLRRVKLRNTWWAFLSHYKSIRYSQVKWGFLQQQQRGGRWINNKKTRTRKFLSFWPERTHTSIPFA